MTSAPELTSTAATTAGERLEARERRVDRLPAACGTEPSWENRSTMPTAPELLNRWT